jgi:hypothetical protein
MTLPPEPGSEGQPNEAMPSPPPNEAAAWQATPASRPKVVDTAFLLWMITAAISAASLIFQVALGGDEFTRAARTSLEQQNRSFTEQDVTTFANAAKFFSLVVGLVFIALFLLFAYRMRTGKNWARITLAVLGGLSIVFTLVGLASSDSLALLIRMADAALIVAAIYYMFRPEANQYFATGRPWPKHAP